MAIRPPKAIQHLIRGGIFGMECPLLHHVEGAPTHLHRTQIVVPVSADAAIAILEGAPLGQTFRIGLRLDDQFGLDQSAHLDGIGAVAERRRSVAARKIHAAFDAERHAGKPPGQQPGAGVGPAAAGRGEDISSAQRFAEAFEHTEGVRTPVK